MNIRKKTFSKFRITRAIGNSALQRWLSIQVLVIKDLRAELYWRKVYLPQLKIVFAIA
jgi:predicted solute-binding protein